MIRVNRVVRLAPSGIWMYVVEGVRGFKGSLSECWIGRVVLNFAARASPGLKSKTGLARHAD